MSASTVLIVDDDPLIRDLIGEILSREGYGVEAVASGDAALAALRNKICTLVLLDVSMPVLDGFQTLEKIKGDPSMREIPVVMLTAARAEKDVRLARSLGVTGYIAKPVNSQKLLENVKRILGNAPEKVTEETTEDTWMV